MLKAVFVFIVAVHGLIHLMGFAKAYKLAELSQLTQDIPRSSGILWLLAAVLFFISLGLMLMKVQMWWLFGAAAVLLSQLLIVMSWRDAKYGTLPNIIILIPVIIAFVNILPSSFANTYRSEVKKRLTPAAVVSLVTEQDLQRLPVPVQRYLRYVGAVGKPRVTNFRAVSQGTMKRSIKSDWIDITAHQYDFFDNRARLFFIESSLYGVPFDGLHMYVGNEATMRIRVASLFPIVHAQGEKMTRAETVTLFNDMCLLAPAALIDTSIQWETVDSLKVRARFTNRGNTIGAELVFNEKGEMTDFISNDRYLSADGKTYESYPWSTPVKDYRDFGGMKVAAYGEAIWHMPEGEYSYAKFDVKEIEYNCSEFR